ncbi:MAG: cytochrome c [SAR324 cluster bacterium]|jgi:mono/diheme cytochrome c family protein|nr:cytochrome c [SAR324 cluster bacterium]MDP6729132.1 cytochrome c [SAR324 cluster bacterium]
MKIINRFLLLFFLFAIGSFQIMAGTVEEQFKIEGLISPASPKALSKGLEKELSVKIVKLNLTDTSSGWPEMTIEYDPNSVSKEQIEKTVASIEDPAGHTYKVHKGPQLANAALTEEEMQSISKLGPVTEAFPELTNPMSGDAESAARGQKLFVKNCAKCHGESGNGYGPVSHGFTTWPRQLWAWNSSGPETDGYLFGFITNGRSDMPPWGIILSENERWDLVSYIKKLKPQSDK